MASKLSKKKDASFHFWPFSCSFSINHDRLFEINALRDSSECANLIALISLNEIYSLFFWRGFSLPLGSSLLFFHKHFFSVIDHVEFLSAISYDTTRKKRMYVDRNRICDHFKGKIILRSAYTKMQRRILQFERAFISLVKKGRQRKMKKSESFMMQNIHLFWPWLHDLFNFNSISHGCC